MSPSLVETSTPNGTTAPAILPAGTWRLVSYRLTYVHATDYPHKCLSCKAGVLIGQVVIGRRSADEHSRRVWGPIEDMIHYACWERLKAAGTALPRLGTKDTPWEKYGDYPWKNW